MAKPPPPYLRPVEDATEPTQGVDALLGALIVRYRRERGLSQAELAARLGIGVAQLEAYESGETRLPASTLHALAQALGVPTGAFFR